ncbi:MAG: hypothetical protein ABI880_05880 [Acidobacteriota bacterium]
MSTSDPTGKRGAGSQGPTTRLVAKAPPDTEVFLIDYTFHLVARSVGTLTREVPAGIYKLKFRRGDVERTVTTVVSGTAEVTVALPDVFEHFLTKGEVVAPLEMAAPASSTASGVWFELAGSPEAPEADLAATLSLCDASGAVVVDVQTIVPTTPSARPTVVTYGVMLAPGSYRLRVALGGSSGRDARGLEQSLVVSPGWQTQALLGMRNHGTTTRPLWRADLANATILMVRPGEVVTSEVRGYAELAKSWIAGPHVTIATAYAEAMPASAVANPLFAMAVAHTLVRGASIARSVGRPEPPDARRLVARIVDAIEPLVPGHPDLAALSLWLGRASRATFAVPPMLLNSWVIVSAAAATRPSLVPRGSLSSSIADRLWGSELWLVWRYGGPAAPLLKKRRGRARKFDELVSLVQAQVKIADDQVLTNLERGLCNAIRELSGATAADPPPFPAVAAPPPTARASSRGVSMRLAKRLGVPAASIDDAIESLLDKLTP